MGARHTALPQDGDGEHDDDALLLRGSAWFVRPVPRRIVLAVLGHLMWAICYADRTNISLAINPMAEERGWGKYQSGLVLSSFFWGYVTTQVLGGWLAYRYGGKPVLAAAVALWSTSTMLTPLATQAPFPVLLGMRVVMGIGEGMALPCLHHLTAAWIPVSERSTFLSVTAAGKFVGTGAAMSSAPLVALWWPSIFYIFGVIGLAWVAVWQCSASSTPATCPHMGRAERAFLHSALAASVGGGANESAVVPDDSSGDDDDDDAERVKGVPSANNRAGTSADSKVNGTDDGRQGERVGLIGRGSLQLESSEAADTSSLTAPGVAPSPSGPRTRSTPWRQLIFSPVVWPVAVCHFCTLWAQYLLISWLPTYFTDQVKLDLGQSGLVLLLPYLSPALLTPAAGFGADCLVKRGWRVAKVRKLLATGALLGPAGTFVVLVVYPAPSVALATAMSTIAVAMLGLGDSGYWAAYVDISPQYAGILLGLGNTLANFAGILVNWSTGYILEAWCVDTDSPRAASDRQLPGFSCSGYTLDAEMCLGDASGQGGGAFDTSGHDEAVFDAGQMCCSCGGGSAEAGWTVVFEVAIVICVFGALVFATQHGHRTLDDDFYCRRRH